MMSQKTTSYYVHASLPLTIRSFCTPEDVQAVLAANVYGIPRVSVSTANTIPIFVAQRDGVLTDVTFVAKTLMSDFLKRQGDGERQNQRERQRAALRLQVSQDAEYARQLREQQARDEEYARRENERQRQRDRQAQVARDAEYDRRLHEEAARAYSHDGEYDRRLNDEVARAFSHDVHHEQEQGWGVEHSLYQERPSWSTFQFN